MTPHLVKWQSKFQDRGFSVVEIDNGQMDDLEDVKTHVEEAGISFPVLHDVLGEVCQRYRVNVYPTAFLVGRDGKVIWQGHPWDADKLQREIEAALSASI
jgi:peroxiredoxin